MKKMFISLVALFALVSGAIVAWLYYQDVLAVGLLMTSLIPSCLFEDGRKEFIKGNRNA